MASRDEDGGPRGRRSIGARGAVTLMAQMSRDAWRSVRDSVRRRMRWRRRFWRRRVDGGGGVGDSTPMNVDGGNSASRPLARAPRAREGSSGRARLRGQARDEADLEWDPDAVRQCHTPVLGHAAVCAASLVIAAASAGGPEPDSDDDRDRDPGEADGPGGREARAPEETSDSRHPTFPRVEDLEFNFDMDFDPHLGIDPFDESPLPTPPCVRMPTAESSLDLQKPPKTPDPRIRRYDEDSDAYESCSEEPGPPKRAGPPPPRPPQPALGATAQRVFRMSRNHYPKREAPKKQPRSAEALAASAAKAALYRAETRWNCSEDGGRENTVDEGTQTDGGFSAPRPRRVDAWTQTDDEDLQAAALYFRVGSRDAGFGSKEQFLRAVSALNRAREDEDEDEEEDENACGRRHRCPRCVSEREEEEEAAGGRGTDDEEDSDSYVELVSCSDSDVEEDAARGAEAREGDRAGSAPASDADSERCENAALAYVRALADAVSGRRRDAGDGEEDPGYVNWASSGRGSGGSAVDSSPGSGSSGSGELVGGYYDPNAEYGDDEEEGAAPSR